LVRTLTKYQRSIFTTSKFKKILKVNSLIIGSIIVADLFVLNRHNPENDTHIRKVAAAKQMKLTPLSRLKSIQADEEQEFDDK
jgi:hypothetical protein